MAFHERTMTTEQVPRLSFSVLSILEDFIKQQGAKSEIDLASRKAEEASRRRYEAAKWLRNVGGGQDLTPQPSEEEFRLGLRSGIILCNALNRVHTGAIAKVVEGPSDSPDIVDGAALSAYQYFENVRNFLVAAEEIGIPSFEASDFEEGGKTARLVNCVLALKSYGEWKANGGTGVWKYSGSLKPPGYGSGGKLFTRKNSELFTNSFSRTTSTSSHAGDQNIVEDVGLDFSEEGNSRSLNSIVRAFISNKKQDDIPHIVTSMLNKVMEELDRRLQSQFPVALRETEVDNVASYDGERTSPHSNATIKESSEDEVSAHTRDASDSGNNMEDQKKQQVLVEYQQRHVQELKECLLTTKSGIQFLQMKYQEEFQILGKHLDGLVCAASGYQRVLEENRKLYNQVQDLKGNIRVYCRVRPFLHGQSNRFNVVDHIEEGNISIITPSKYIKEGRKSFSFNKVFDSLATQEEVFSDTQPLIRSVLDGYNVCIFAYGQTGSGKTFTMTGPKELTEESQGVNYRALNDLFVLSDQRKDTISYDISVQMLEIYNEQVRDLLSNDSSNKRLDIRNSSQNGINVPDACLVRVSSTADVINIMSTGNKNRAVGATAMNDRSSRSHSCLTVHVQGRIMASGTVLRGSMNLVDLAGSERVDKSEATGDRLKEAQYINKSLSSLGDVISSLALKNAHVPYRNSKLTQLLQDSLGGQAKTLMFVHISPEPEAISETISTLKFAERVASVELGAARVNKEGGEVKELKEQVAALKAALGRKDYESEQSQDPPSRLPERSLSSKSTLDSQTNSVHNYGHRGNPERHRRNTETTAQEHQTRKSFIPRRRSLDPRDLMNSPPRPSSSPALNLYDNEREFSSGDWIDKVMINRNAMVTKDDSLLQQWEEDSRQLPDIFFQNQIRETYKIYPEQLVNNAQISKTEAQVAEPQNSKYDTDESEELEVGTSDSSEADLQWQSNIPRLNSFTKLSPGGTRNPDPRRSIPSLIPSPSRKLANGVGRGKQAVHPEGKRKVGHAK